VTEQAKIAEVETDRARQMVADELGSRERELADLKQMLATNADKLAVAQAAHAETLRKQRELNDAARELELTVEKRVRQELAAVHERAKIDAEDDLKAKVSEKEAQIAAMQRRIEDLRRKADQGSQQLQGEAHHPLGVQEYIRSRRKRLGCQAAVCDAGCDRSEASTSRYRRRTRKPGRTADEDGTRLSLFDRGALPPSRRGHRRAVLGDAVGSGSGAQSDDEAMGQT